jgi:integrase/recombinase XerC
VKFGFQIFLKGSFSGGSCLLLEEAIALFIKYLHHEKGYSKHTRRNYQVDLEQFSSFLVEKSVLARKETGCDVSIEEIESTAIRKYVGSLYGKRKRTTIARKLSAVRTFFLFLEKEGAYQDQSGGGSAKPQTGKIHSQPSSRR